MKRKSLALLMAAVMAFGAAGCSSGRTDEASADQAPAAESGSEAAGEAAASGDGFYAGKTVEMIVP